ncbi:MAG: hypothetical protein SWX82_33505 [Cyanobacteriota bacterium]|nr:hypothetical protein [Cyanobacteriota bacterium]
MNIAKLLIKLRHRVRCQIIPDRQQPKGKWVVLSTRFLLRSGNDNPIAEKITTLTI